MVCKLCPNLKKFSNTHFLFLVHWQVKEETQKIYTVERLWNSSSHVTTSLARSLYGANRQQSWGMLRPPPGVLSYLAPLDPWGGAVSLWPHAGNGGQGFVIKHAILDAEKCLAPPPEAVNNTLNSPCKCCGPCLHAQLVCWSIFTSQIGSVKKDGAVCSCDLHSQCDLNSVNTGRPGNSIQGKPLASLGPPFRKVHWPVFFSDFLSFN